MEKLSRKIGGGFIQYPEKVLQFGGGNFLRAFVDWQIDVMNRTTDFNASIVIVQSMQAFYKIKSENKGEAVA